MGSHKYSWKDMKLSLLGSAAIPGMTPCWYWVQEFCPQVWGWAWTRWPGDGVAVTPTASRVRPAMNHLDHVSVNELKPNAYSCFHDMVHFGWCCVLARPLAAFLTFWGGAMDDQPLSPSQMVVPTLFWPKDSMSELLALGYWLSFLQGDSFCHLQPQAIWNCRF